MTHTWTTLASGIVVVNGEVPTLHGFELKMFRDGVERWRPNAVKHGESLGVPYYWILGMIYAESLGRQKIVSPDGGYGLMQLTHPSVFQGHPPADTLTDPDLNIQLGSAEAARIRVALRKKGLPDDLPRVASCYNAGSEGGAPHVSYKNLWGMRQSPNYIDRAVAGSNTALAEGIVSEIETYRKLAKEYLTVVCNGPEPLKSPLQGRDTKDKIYLAVIEGRNYKPPSSSCGDLGQFLPFRLGCRQKWINREEHDGWHFSGQPGHPVWDNNVTTLAAKSVNGLARKPVLGEKLHTGDTLVVNTSDPNTTHVSVVYEDCVLVDGAVLITGDYGQPGGAIRARQITVTTSGRIKVQSRFLDVVLPLEDVIKQARSTGKLEAAEPVEVWLKRLKLVPAAPAAEAVFRPCKRGDKDPKGSTTGPVRTWQKRLLAAGYKLPQWGADGSWGDETSTATESVQRQHGRPVHRDELDQATWDACKK